jgi:hypothetical protein
MLYRHIFQGKAKIDIDELGREAAEAFGRAFI